MFGDARHCAECHAPKSHEAGVEPEGLVYAFADWSLTWKLVPSGTAHGFVDRSGFDRDKARD